MSWDIIIFNSRQIINSVEEVDENQLEPTDFCAVLEDYFENIVKEDDHRAIKGEDYIIDYFADEKKVSNKVLSLYGENGFFELVILARKQNWQIFDTGLGQMIDLENPSANGFENFQRYLQQIVNDTD